MRDLGLGGRAAIAGEPRQAGAGHRGDVARGRYPDNPVLGEPALASGDVDVLDVIEAVALDLLGGERNGLVDWSLDGLTYDGLRAEIEEMSSPEVLREVLGAIEAAR